MEPWLRSLQRELSQERIAFPSNIAADALLTSSSHRFKYPVYLFGENTDSSYPQLTGYAPFALDPRPHVDPYSPSGIRPLFNQGPGDQGQTNQLSNHSWVVGDHGRASQAWSACRNSQGQTDTLSPLSPKQHPHPAKRPRPEGTQQIQNHLPDLGQHEESVGAPFAYRTPQTDSSSSPELGRHPKRPKTMHSDMETQYSPQNLQDWNYENKFKTLRNLIRVWADDHFAYEPSPQDQPGGAAAAAATSKDKKKPLQFSKKLIGYIEGLVGRERDWRALIDSSERGYLASGLLAKWLEEHVFDCVAFGASNHQEHAILRLERHLAAHGKGDSRTFPLSPLTDPCCNQRLNSDLICNQ